MQTSLEASHVMMTCTLPCCLTPPLHPKPVHASPPAFPPMPCASPPPVTPHLCMRCRFDANCVMMTRPLPWCLAVPPLTSACPLPHTALRLSAPLTCACGAGLTRTA